jgi:hypothetical protein
MFMSPVVAARNRLVSPEMRDRFLTALDAQDHVTLHDIADYLVGCENPLPSTTCTLLGLQPGSTYGDGAAAIARSRVTKIFET